MVLVSMSADTRPEGRQWEREELGREAARPARTKMKEKAVTTASSVPAGRVPRVQGSLPAVAKRQRVIVEGPTESRCCHNCRQERIRAEDNNNVGIVQPHYTAKFRKSLRSTQASLCSNKSRGKGNCGGRKKNKIADMCMVNHLSTKQKKRLIRLIGRHQEQTDTDRTVVTVQPISKDKIRDAQQKDPVIGKVFV